MARTRFVLTAQSSPNPSEQGLHEIRWIAEQLSRGERDLLASFPEQLVVRVEGLGEILFCHAPPRSDEELFTHLTPEDRLNDLFSEVKMATILEEMIRKDTS